jgi:A-macroglobulin complement component/alpha-2-macroglobulin family protein/carboxypeptidase family protein/MG2 domain-containing protein/A-macroglobulin receptor
MKTFKTLLSFFVFSVTLLGLAETAKPKLTVAESEMRATLGYDSFIISVPVRNTLSTPVSGKLNLELLGPEDDVLATASAERVLKPGATQFKLDLLTRSLKLEAQFPWYRVRYRISADSMPLDEGMVALGAITSDLFDITVTYSEMAEKGKPYVLHVHAFNPVVHRPAGGVAIIASYDNRGNGNRPVTKTSQITNATGDADLTLSLPAAISPDDDHEIKLQAKKGPVSYERVINFSLNSRTEIRLQTDKPLYQPKQTVHLRSLSFGSGRAAVGETITFVIEDPERNVAFKAEAKTNKYGIASVDWAIPESARLGEYEIRAESDETSSEQKGYAAVRVSQYDLPNFTLSAAGDRSYYLPGENALVAITARYLFGQPIPHGSVRLMLAPEGKWDWRNQKWEASEGEEVKGVLDAEGRIKLAISLQKAHEEFKQNGYLRFRDVDCLVSVTDPSTGKSERSRFTLRLSHEDIHVYIISSSRRDKASASFSVATYYPDGSPAAVQVQISQLESDEKERSQAPREQALRTIKTNRYGLAKVDDLPLRQSAEEAGNIVLLLTARDSKGRTGRQTENLWFNDRPFVNVLTNKTLYREGEPIEVTLRCTNCEGNFHVEIAQDGVVVASQRTHLRHGKGFLVFPSQRQFQSELSVQAYPTDVGDDWYSGAFPGSRTILFPRDSELKLNVSLNHETYLPAGEMNATIRVRSSDGAAQQGALGVVLVDKAVEERAREDGLAMADHWWSPWKPGAAAGGITRHDLDQIDLSRPVPPELDLAAEIILNSEGRMVLPKVSGSGYAEQTPSIFQKILEKELAPLYTALSCSGLPDCTFPVDEAAVQSILARHNAIVGEMRDPWGTPFRIHTEVQYTQRVVTVTSAGPDKLFDTDDDFTVKRFFWNYFNAVGKVVDAAVREAHARSGSFVRDYATLRSEMLQRGIDLDKLTDPWGHPYLFEFSVNGPRLLVTAKTRGTGGTNAEKAEPYALWTSSINYFENTQKMIDQALNRYLHDAGEFPHDEATFRSALARSSISFEELRDPWGSPYYVTFRRLPEYGATVVVKPDKAGSAQIDEQPATRMIDWIWINSRGPDLAEHTGDDFPEASFSRVVSVESADVKVRSGPELAFADLTGAINGVVVDLTGAVIPNAKVTAMREGDTNKYTATTNGEGRYLIQNLPAGLYSVEIYAPGFQAFVIQRVPVHSSSLTEVDARLNVGMASETVEVSAAAPVVETTMSSLSMKTKPALPEAQIRVPTSTPHVREYFPETLYWQPSLITDRSGNAALKVKLADTITTWKLVAFASTEDGRVGIAEKDVRAFQPFFAEHDPPKVLTLGDEITLPVIVRNYLKKVQTVDVTMKPTNWFSIAGSQQQRVVVKQNEAGRAAFQIRANESIDDGKQQVSAISGDAGDAVEKQVKVHPYGERRVTVSNQFALDAAMEIDVPADAIAGSLHAQLKIYPNLMAHVIESIEAGLTRPYGCGEQTISSTYPSLMVMKYYRAQEKEPPVAARARRYLREGYERLLRYQEPGGGFSYWGHGDPNVSLTAYALRFLTESRRLIEVDPARISAALTWLVRQQDAKSSWESDDSLSAYVLWTLAELEFPQPSASVEAEMVKASLANGLTYLTARTAASSDAYVTALSVLALVRAGRHDAAAPLVGRLASAAHVKDGMAYWELSGSTLFHSWGLPGQVEVTALVVHALHAFSPPGDQGPTHEIANQGLLFLARKQDQYGVWYSGQTTWNVLNVMLESTKESLNADQAVEARIIVNGKLAKPVEIPQEKQSTGPIYLDLTNYIAAGKNKVEIQAGKPIALAGAQVSADYYVPWTSVSGREARKSEGAQALRLAVHFDKTEASPGESIDCKVEVERIGRYGWGMMLAEIGLPPGADVDRASLESAVTASGWELNHYEVLPDRVVVYLWPRAGGTKFHFIFKPRYEMRAYSAPSTLYDYYNPEANVVVAPEIFHISASQLAAIVEKR